MSRLLFYVPWVYSRVAFRCRRLFGAGRRSFVSRSLGGFLLCRSLLGLLAGGKDVGDPNHGVILAMPALAARILTAALLEGDHLRAPGMLHDLTRHRRTS